MVRSCLGIVLVAIFVLQSSVVCSGPPLRIAYPSFVPFHYLGEEDRALEGLFYDIITEAVENRLGVPLVWTSYPWTRCQESVKSGKNDAIMTVPTVERASYTRTHLKPFYQKKLQLFTFAGHPQLTKITKIESLTEIRDYSFSVITYSSNGWHKKNVQSLGITTYETGTHANVWKMLAKKRGDLVIEWPMAAMPYISRLGLQNQVVDTGAVVSFMPFHLLIRSGSIHTDILEKFDSVIEAMRQDGTLNAIEEKYQQ